MQIESKCNWYSKKALKILTSRSFHAIAKLLCNLLDISTFHGYAIALPKLDNDS